MTCRGYVPVYSKQWLLWRRRVTATKYTSDAIFPCHAATLVFLNGFPRGSSGDALYHFRDFADKAFNPLVPYQILAGF